MKFEMIAAAAYLRPRARSGAEKQAAGSLVINGWGGFFTSSRAFMAGRLVETDNARYNRCLKQKALPPYPLT